jgi:hypothetical protein
VHHDVEAALFGHDVRHRRVGRGLRQHVELDCAQVMTMGKAPVAQLAHLGGVAALRVAHAGVNRVAGLGQRAGGEVADAGGGAGDEDDGFHDDDFLKGV